MHTPGQSSNQEEAALTNRACSYNPEACPVFRNSATSTMRTQKYAIVILIIIVVFWASFFSPCPALQIQEMRSGVKLYRSSVKEGDEFTIDFIHSIERTPVREVFRVGEDYNIYLVGTVYESFGTGLPTMPDEGAKLVLQGGKIRITGMHRKLEPFLIAVSPVPGHVLTIGEERVV